MNSFIRIVLFCSAVVLYSCGDQPVQDHYARAENLYEDSISTSFTTAMPDGNGEGLRITYTFFNMKRADTGNFKMTHIYMQHTGEEDTSIVNGTWKLNRTDSGVYVDVYSGRKRSHLLFTEDGSTLSTFNTDSLLADTGMLYFREKADNDLRNSTVKVPGRIFFNADRNAYFIDMIGDTMPVMKISAYRDLIAWNDSVNIDSNAHFVQILVTFQIRMAIDG